MLTIRLLGQFEITLNGERLHLPTRAAESLAAWLLLHPGPQHQRDFLAGLLWPDTTETNARNNLRHALWRLRQAIPDDYLRVDARSIGWRADAPYTLDVDALRNGSPETSAGAVDAYAGELLPGFYDEWIIRERERLAALYDEQMGRLLENLLAVGEWRQAIERAEGWIAHGHAPEPAYRALIHAHAALGDRSAALAAYQRCVDALESELGVPPSPKTTALADAIHNSQFTVHHLQFPTPQAPPTNLPPPTTPLIGRENELAALAALLADPAHRLVTILGPGGMGKSRLALAAASEAMPHFANGVYLVELAALTAADDIPRAVADALGYLFQNDGRPPHRQLFDLLADRQILLLLDNFEHLLDGAGFVVALLENAPGLRLLLTSRERLRLHAETLFRLEGLTYPTQEAPTGSAADYTALELFAQSARRVRRDFTPTPADWPAIAHICRLVGGAPLGVILAAAWVEHLSPAEIADEIAANIDLLAQELRDLEPRHRSIEALFAQSWQRLSPAERGALMGVSVCAGGFDRQAAQAIAGAGLPLLTRLVDSSLLWRVGEGRYDLHELIRQMARRRLQEAGAEEHTRGIHSRYYLGFVAQQTARLKGGQQEAAVESLAAEHENVRAAWGWAAQKGAVDLLAAALEGLGIALNRPGQWQEGAALMDRAIAALPEPDTAEALLLRAGLLVWHAIFLTEAMQLEPAEARFDEATALLDEPALTGAETRPLRGLIALHRAGPAELYRRPEQVIVARQRAADLFEEVGDVWWWVRAQIAVGSLENGIELAPQVEKRFRSLRRIAQASNDFIGLATALNHLSLLLEYAGRFAEAEAMVEEWRQLPIRRPHHFSLWDRSAWVAFCVGRFQDALDGLLDPFPEEPHLGLTPERNQMGYNGVARAYNHLGDFQRAYEMASYAQALWVKVYGEENLYFLRTVGMALLGLGKPKEAEDILSRRRREEEAESESTSPLAGDFVDEAYPFLVQGEMAATRLCLVQGLEITRQTETYRFAVQALPAAALLLAMEGRLEEAAFVHGAIRRYAYLTNSRWYAAVALDRLAETLAPLPADARAAAEGRGRGMELPELTDEVLALL